MAATATECPKGCIESTSPAGDRIFVRAPRKGEHYRINHPLYGHALVPAKSQAEAVEKFAKEHVGASNKEMVTRLTEECRIAKLA